MTIKNEKDFENDLDFDDFDEFNAFSLAIIEFWEHHDISGYSPDEI